MTKPNPTEADEAHVNLVHEYSKALGVIDSLRRERELLCELADTEIKAAAPMHIAGLIRRARAWKKGQGL